MRKNGNGRAFSEYDDGKRYYWPAEWAGIGLLAVFCRRRLSSSVTLPAAVGSASTSKI